MNHRRLFASLALISIALSACNSTSSDRFSSQKESYLFESTSSSLTAYGASSVLNTEDSNFRCPVVSGMNTESNVTVFKARANAPLPHFELDTISGIRGDNQGGFGISMIDLPIGLLDVYQKCGASSREKWTTYCPPDYEIVSDCSSVADGTNACARIYEGAYKLVVSAQMADDKSCISEEIDRTPYSAQSISYPAYACDAFDPIELPAAYRGNMPSNDCCSVYDYGSLDFCLKPCGCRKLTVQFVPKNEFAPEDQKDDEASVASKDLKLAVFSNVEGDDKAFLKLIQSIQSKNVDLTISLGNLTFSGSEEGFAEKRAYIDSYFTTYDGLSAGSNCSVNGEMICCSDSNDRLFKGTCNAILNKTGFLASLGENEFEGDIQSFNGYFGPSYASTVIGKVQVIMLDTADAGIPDSEKNWLEDVLNTPKPQVCNIPKPAAGEKWPTLAECHQKMSSSKGVTCRDCIAQEAYCIPPDAERSDPFLGPENCVCVPMESKVCSNNMICKEMNGTDSECICTRDSDCGQGGSCVNGACKPPVRLVFSYTPLFDEFGSRNNSFTSKTDAASLLSLLGKSNVSAVFSGRVRDYASYSKAGIGMYITGGGGAEMTSFSRKGHHWLLVTIPKAYSNPDPDAISVEVVEF